jgi:uncharacterized protein (DUF2147 family)
MKRLLIITIGLILFSLSSFAQELTEGQWWSPEKDGKFEFYLAKNGYYYGKLVWSKKPEKKDVNNPDESKRDEPVVGSLIFTKFEKKSNKLYEDGEIYDPKSGKTYDGTIRLVDENTMELRGYIGVSWLGRTETMTRVQ